MRSITQLTVDQIKNGYKLTEDEFQNITYPVKRKYIKLVCDSGSGLTDEEFSWLHLLPELEKYYKKLREKYFIVLENKNISEYQFNRLCRADKLIFSKVAGKMKVLKPAVLNEQCNRNYSGIYHYHKNKGYKIRKEKWLKSKGEEYMESLRERSKVNNRRFKKSDRGRIQQSLWMRAHRERKGLYKTKRRWFQDRLFASNNEGLKHPDKKQNVVYSFLNSAVLFVAGKLAMWLK